MVVNFLRSEEGGTVLPSLNNPANANNVASGYDFINEDGERVVGTLTTQGARTYTPSTNNQTITGRRILTGVQTISGDTDLTSSNIRSGVTIFDVTGTYVAQSNNTYNSTATRSSQTSLTAYVGFLPNLINFNYSAAGNAWSDAISITLDLMYSQYWISGWKGDYIPGSSQGLLRNSSSPLSSYAASYTYSGGQLTVYLSDWTFGSQYYYFIAYTV